MAAPPLLLLCFVLCALRNQRRSVFRVVPSAQTRPHHDRAWSAHVLLGNVYPLREGASTATPTLPKSLSMAAPTYLGFVRTSRFVDAKLLRPLGALGDAAAARCCCRVAGKSRGRDACAAAAQSAHL
ncbi:hypothetical protein HPB50_020740 [Hyalomma asiaticum]|uniref:Uncharacterized protein n=1 Tax=Hyalomma asiaticum TaxID=266040 RepID=A0ACB7RMW3_HYAAI|nr:hypothetical protein HPB50_020740 [Hyalomma asiaticum]